MEQIKVDAVSGACPDCGYERMSFAADTCPRCGFRFKRVHSQILRIDVFRTM